MDKNLDNIERNLSAVFCSERMFHEFITQPDLSYYECAKKFFKERDTSLSKKELKEFCYKNLYYQQISLIREILCLVQNAVKRGRVDLTNEAFVAGMAELKERTIVSGDKSMTNYNYIKAVRNVLAHNNELQEMPKITYGSDTSDKDVLITSEEAGAVFKLTINDFNELCTLIFKSINKTDGLGLYPRRLENAIVGEYFDVEKINRYMNGYADGETYDLNLDEYQKQAIINYIKSGVVNGDQVHIPLVTNKKEKYIRLVYPDIIKQVFPATSKPEDLALHKYFLFNANSLIFQDLDRTKDDVLECVKSQPEFTQVFMSYCLNSNYGIFLSVTNGLYSVLSDRELTDIEKEFVEKLGEENVRHIRNCLQHGTYYYNFDNGMEVYDGGKKLKHITTVNLNKTAFNLHGLIIKRLKEESEKE